MVVCAANQTTVREVMGFSLTQSSVIQFGSTSKLDFLFTYFLFEKGSSFSFEIGHSLFCVVSLVHLLEFLCALDNFTGPRVQKRSSADHCVYDHEIFDGFG